jgi:Zinc-binding dehydrogenase
VWRTERKGRAGKYSGDRWRRTDLTRGTAHRQFYLPAEIIMIDLGDNRLEVAKRFGATATINSSDGKAQDAVMKMTGKRGVDTRHHSDAVQNCRISEDRPQAPGYPSLQARPHPRCLRDLGACRQAT